MDKTNQKIMTLSFVAFSALIGLSLSLLLKTFAASFAVVARIHSIDLVKHGLPVGVAILLFVSRFIDFSLPFFLLLYFSLSFF